MHRLLVAAGLAVVMAFSGAVVAADRQAIAGKVYETIFNLENNLNKASTDLIEMRMGMLKGNSLSDKENEVTEEILRNADRIEAFAETYSLLTAIYSVMVNEKDKATVLRFIRIKHKRVEKYFERAITNLNTQLPQLRTPALISQSERIRDNIRQIEEAIQSWTP